MAEGEMIMGAKRRTARAQFKRWLKHWYLGGGTTENRNILTEEAKAEEKMIFREFHRMIDASIGENASEARVKG